MTPAHPSTPVEDLRRFGQFLVDQASPDTARFVARRALVNRRAPARRRRFVVALAAAVLLSSSTVALGVVADTAAPGDLLYPFDRAIETAVSIFGTGDNSGERIDEAEALLARGDLSRAILALGEAVEAHDQGTAQELVVASGGLAAGETRAAVADLVADLVANARQVVTAARQGDQDDLRAAIAAMADRTTDLSAAAGQEVMTPDDPSINAPGQGGTGKNDAENNPNVTAPGQNSRNGNGQNQATDNPSVTAPGQSSRNGNGNGSGQGNGQP